jgi:hypothetical protein
MKERKPQANTRGRKRPSTSTAVTAVPSALLRLSTVLREIAQTAEPALSTHGNSSSARKRVNNRPGQQGKKRGL